MGPRRCRDTSVDKCCGTTVNKSCNTLDKDCDTPVADCCDSPGDDCCDTPGEDCCDDETCYEADSTSTVPSTQTLECCNTNEEHCDVKCIYAAATAECEKTCDGDAAHDAATGHEHVHDQNGQHGSACNSHIAKAFEQYSAYLETARCICRSILERGLPSAACCNGEQQQRQSASQKHRGGHLDTHTTTSKSRHGQGLDVADAETTAHGLRKKATHHHHGMKRRLKAKQQNPAGDHGQGHDHSKMVIEVVKEDCKSDCCGADRGRGDCQTEPMFTNVGKPLATVLVGERDIEDGAALEYVALIVDGMTCSGCGNKFERTLKAASPGVSGVRVNFVMGSAEFSLDPSYGDKAEDVIRIAERATGFRCARMSDGDQTLDLLVASNRAAAALCELQVQGVTQVAPLDKKRVRVTYDPAVIGPRTLLERIGDLSGGLAPPSDDPSISSGRKRLWDQLIKTIVAAVLTLPVLVLAWGKESVHVDPITSASVSIALATLVQFVAVPDFYRPAISALIHSGSVEMDMLVVISITAAYVYSLVAFGHRVAGAPLETAEFFETSTLLITLIVSVLPVIVAAATMFAAKKDRAATGIKGGGGL
ncbi:cation-transporting ATPase pacS [Magnaporthiopsis poae ATCC 64411]|uniref:Cation-transporting ATPase pacS n=1 Tax=Magnaporthiopsis poae (strain ATCC 64411 / 73-15) TaxID=644358 RepID=A0A0C4DNT5_MAGP6|nr:cation-transporting ATPase pacS [Magnaporthiopsis poae ATCC 64411]